MKKIACLSTGFLCRSNSPLGLPQRRFCHGPKVSRIEARGDSLSHVNSILTEKCILRIPLSSDFLQIIGRKQIDSHIQKSGLDSKGLSAIESNSNLTRTLFKDYSFEG